MKHLPKLEISTPSDREVRLHRVFAAPRAAVFEALTKPELLKRWLRAPGRTLEVCEVDLRVGGGFRYLFRGPGRRDVGMRGVYQELRAPERIVNTEVWEDWDAGETQVTTVLSEEAGGTSYTSTIRFPSKATRDEVLKAGLEDGAGENYEGLDQLLAGGVR